jgi:ankyrin repeat protein
MGSASTRREVDARRALYMCVRHLLSPRSPVLDRELFNEVRISNYDRIEELLEKGANANARDDYGGMPLHVATAWGRVDIVKLLIKKGVDVDVKNNSGLTPLHMAVYWNHPGSS